jgi:hypothetical protein
MHIRLVASSPTSPPKPPPRRAPAPRRNTITRTPADPRPSETLDPRVSALPASGTPEFESNRPIKTNRLTGGSSNPAESTGRSGSIGDFGTSGLGQRSGLGAVAWTRSEVGRRRRENFGDSWEERSRLGEQSRARAETASEFGSRDGERGDDVSSRPLRTAGEANSTMHS